MKWMMKLLKILILSDDHKKRMFNHIISLYNLLNVDYDTELAVISSQGLLLYEKMNYTFFRPTPITGDILGQIRSFLEDKDFEAILILLNFKNSKTIFLDKRDNLIAIIKDLYKNKFPLLLIFCSSRINIEMKKIHPDIEMTLIDRPGVARYTIEFKDVVLQKIQDRE